MRNTVASRFRLIVFDLDGTLIDSRRDLAESANEILQECGCQPHAEEAIGRMVGDGAATLVARVFATAHCPQPPDALQRFLALYNSRLLRFTRPYPGIPELLATLDGRATLGVLTNKPLAPTRAILDGLDLAKHFGSLVVGGDGPLPRKPDPSGLADLISRAGVESTETVLVGDSVIDSRTARAAKAFACGARYGYGFADFPSAEMGQGPFIDHPSELLAVL